jgi:putative membrane-bound dehydrogenase-like protein
LELSVVTKRWHLLLAVLAAAHPTLVSAQVPPEKALSTLTAPEGMELSLWASEPMFVNPTCMDIDHKGRVWVCESVNYRCRLHGRPLRRPAGDRILILEDTQLAGKANKATVFYQSPQLIAPLGIAVAKEPTGPGYKVYVCHSPDILVFEDKNGDGKADGPPRKLLSGFGGYDNDHGVHGITIGPDNRLYFSVGDTGVKDLQSSDRKGRRWNSNDTDCRAGTIWRCDLDGKNLELVAHNFRNDYEPCVDSYGTVFVSDNDDDGNQQTRICYVMPGGNYGYHPRGPGQTHWHEEQPGVVPKILRTWFGSPAGMCVYEGSLLPQKYRGQLLHTDAGPRHLRCYHLETQGASYNVEREDMVTSTDSWFRPIDVCVAPDGSVFIADWYDPGVGGHAVADLTRGRIYRLAPRGHQPKVPDVDLGSPGGIRNALASPALSVRYMAMARLRNLPINQVKQVLEPALGQKDNPFLQARAFWHLYCRSELETLEVATACARQIAEPSNPLMAPLAMRLIKDCHRISPAHYVPDFIKILYRLSPQVRREALLQVRDVDPAKAKSLILRLATQHDGKDRFYLEAVGIAVGRHDARRREILLADFEQQILEWDDKVADLVWELQPPSVMPLLEKRLVDENLSAAQRARIVDILGASSDRNAGKVLLAALGSNVPAEVRLKAFDNLRLYLPGKWQHLRGTSELKEAIAHLVSASDPSSRVTGLALIGLTQRAQDLDQVRKLAAAQEPEAVRRAAVQALGSLPAAGTIETLNEVLARDKDLRGEAVQALSQLSQQKTDARTAAAALKRLQQMVSSAQENSELAHAALEALASTYAGSKWLLDLHDRKQLPEALRADAARLLRNSPFQVLRNRALIAFPPQSRLDPKKLPSLEALARRNGNEARGRQLLAGSARSDLQCLKCHSVRGSGGHIGPDLSVIGKKASKENLFESILYPSRAIAEQFFSWVVETNKGQTLTGLLVEETPTHITLRDGNGKDTVIDKKDIDARAKSPKSIMPEDLVGAMTEDDLVDLVAYLYTLKEPVMSLDHWYIAGAFDAAEGGLDRVFEPEKEVKLESTYEGKFGKVTWRTVRPNDQGYFDLQAFYSGQSNNIVSYLYREVESPADQEAAILLGSDDGVKLWLNGELVHTSTQTRAAAPEQDRVKVKLRRGVNRLLLKIANGDGAHGFYLAIVADKELKPLGAAR